MPVVSGVVAQDGDVSADGAAGLAGGDGHGVDGGVLVDEQSLPVGGGEAVGELGGPESGRSGKSGGDGASEGSG